MKLARLAKSSIALFSESEGLYAAPKNSLTTSYISGGTNADTIGNSISNISHILVPSSLGHCNSEAAIISSNIPVTFTFSRYKY